MSFDRIMRCLSVAAISIVSHSINAAAAESWVCAYPWSTQTIIERFNVDGDDLIETMAGVQALHFKILQNNQFSIVAAWSTSEIESNHTQIGAVIVLIDKMDGSFRRSNAMLDQEPDAAASAFGHCTHEP